MFSIRQARKMTISLIVSITLNAIFLALIIYGFTGGFLLSSQEFKGRLQSIRHLPTAEGSSHLEVLEEFSHMLAEQLIEKLKDSTVVEGAYSERDLALGCLVSLHYFDVNRALSGDKIPSERSILLDQVQKIKIYMGLSDEQFSQIYSFATQEAWPLTAEGLFLALREYAQPEESLVEAFYLTPEFLAIWRHFLSQGVEKREVLELLLQGSWELWHYHYQASIQGLESSCNLRRHLLVTYIHADSAKAAEILVKTEESFCKTLEDATLLSLLKLQIDQPEMQRLADYFFHHSENSQIVELCSSYRVQEEGRGDRQDRVYIVQRGDSLWKISKHLHVSVQEIKSLNNLQSDTLQPGLALRIPS